MAVSAKVDGAFAISEHLPWKLATDVLEARIPP